MISLPSISECLTPRQRTTPSPPPAEQPTENTSESGAPLEESDPDESGRSARSRSAYPPHSGSAGRRSRPMRGRRNDVRSLATSKVSIRNTNQQSPTTGGQSNTCLVNTAKAELARNSHIR